MPIRHIGGARIADKEKNNRAERLHGTLKDWIKSKKGLKNHAQEVVEGYRIYYNYVRPHIALGCKSPSHQEHKWVTLIAKKRNINKPNSS